MKRQKPGATIGTKFAPPYICIFIDAVEAEFLESQELQPSLWLLYIDDVFFRWWMVGRLTEKKNSVNFSMSLAFIPIRNLNTKFSTVLLILLT